MTETITVENFIKELEHWITVTEKQLGGSKEALKSTIYYDFANVEPTFLDSYRGYYDQLALGICVDSPYAERKTVSQLLTDLRKSIGKTYHGWKGGDYKMTSKTLVHVANPGETSDTIIIGVRDNYGTPIICTLHIKD